ncbi:MAG: DHH family phosphoesterase, partial [Pseudomonadales bacterium]|nr:DHH family phosphoesterase [Pseudomonadales bacterium]
YSYIEFWRENQENSFREFVNVCLDKFKTNNNEFPFNRKELKAIKTAFKTEKKMIKKAEKDKQFRKDGEGNKYLYLEIPYKISYVAHYLLNKYTNIDYVLCYNTFRKKDNKISLRSRKDDTLNCNSIAKKYGGGGHFVAAGAEFSKDTVFFENLRKGKVHLL